MTHEPSHYLVVDLEATTDRAGFPREDMEVIEIGAVLVEPEKEGSFDIITKSDLISALAYAGRNGS